jgi:hypothetical protein
MSSFKYEISGYLEEDIIHELTCPISCEIMTYPVVTPYGHKFDYYSIIKWLETHNTCPFSRKPLRIKDLLRDTSIRKKLDFYLFVDKIKKINVSGEKEVDIPTNPDFSFLDDHTRRMVEKAYYTVSRLNEWDYIKNYNSNESGGFLLSKDEIIINILTEIENDYMGHSGCSIGITIRMIEKIAKHGFEKFRKDSSSNESHVSIYREMREQIF